MSVCYLSKNVSAEKVRKYEEHGKPKASTDPSLSLSLHVPSFLLLPSKHFYKGFTFHRHHLLHTHSNIHKHTSKHTHTPKALKPPQKFLSHAPQFFPRFITAGHISGMALLRPFIWPNMNHCHQCQRAITRLQPQINAPSVIMTLSRNISHRHRPTKIQLTTFLVPVA